MPIFSLLIPTSTYLLTFLSRPALTVLTLCSCMANLFTIVTNQYGIISLSSSFLFSCLLSCKPKAMNILLLLVGLNLYISLSDGLFSRELNCSMLWMPNVDMWVGITGALHSKSPERRCRRTAYLRRAAVHRRVSFAPKIYISLAIAVLVEPPATALLF